MVNSIIHIFFIKQEEKLPEEIFQQFLLLLPVTFQKDIHAYKHWQSAQSSLLGKTLLQYGFKQLNLNHSLNDIQIGKKDRPFISADLDFNISHSGDFVICAIVNNARVGIDIEKHRKLRMNIADKYLNSLEYNMIELSGNPEREFFNFWSVKESAIKCDGRGVEVLSYTHVLPVKDNSSLSSDKVICDGKTYSFSKINMDEHYSCAVCCTEPFDLKLNEIQLTDLV